MSKETGGFAERKRQGFTAVQAVALAETEGVTTPNAYGRLPLCMTDGTPDPDCPDTTGDYSYWDHVDFAVETAAKHVKWVKELRLKREYAPFVPAPELLSENFSGMGRMAAEKGRTGYWF